MEDQINGGQQNSVPQTVAPASAAEKAALFSAGGSLWMLVAAIVATVSLVTTFVGNVLTLNIFGFIGMVLDILIAVGLWVTFAKCRKKSLGAGGIKLIKIPYIILFVFTVIGFVFDLIGGIFMALATLGLGIIPLLLNILTFVFECICFASVKKTLNVAQDIAQDKSAAGKKTGIFAAVVMIIVAALNLIGDISGYLLMDALADALPGFLGTLLGTSGIITIVVAVVSFLASISVALVLIQFHKKIKSAHNG